MFLMKFTLLIFIIGITISKKCCLITLEITPGLNICFNSTDPSSYQHYINSLQRHVFRNAEEEEGKVIRCNLISNANETCFIDDNSIYPCNNGDWGYNSSNPCFVVYLMNFLPIPYLNDDPKEIPNDVETFKNDINQYIKNNRKEFNTKILEPLYYSLNHCNGISYYESEAFYEIFYSTNINNRYFRPVFSFRVKMKDNSISFKVK